MEHAELSCIQCGHTWHPLYPHRKPRICPNCKSQNWEKPKETQTTPVAEILDPQAAEPSTPGIPNDELVDEIKDLRKQIELLKEKMEKIEKRCNSALCIRTL